MFLWFLVDRWKHDMGMLVTANVLKPAARTWDNVISLKKKKKAKKTLCIKTIVLMDTLNNMKLWLFNRS